MGLISKMKIETLDDNILYIFKSEIAAANTYCFIKNNEALLIDAVESDQLRNFLIEQSVNQIVLLLTHGHYDHIMNVSYLRKLFDIIVICSINGKEVMENPRKNLSAVANHINFYRKESKQQSVRIKNITSFSITCNYTLKDREVYKWNNLNFKIIYTPGHSIDSACYLLNDTYLFSGDTLLKWQKPILRFPGGNMQDYIHHTKPILQGLSDTMEVFPGHGDRFIVSEGIII